MTNTKTVDFFKKHNKCKKVIVYQNLRFFLIPSLIYEKINPNHKIIVRGIKKRRHSKHKTAGYEKIAMLLKEYYPIYIFSLYLVMGWLWFCKTSL